jgi:hypothetical protein
MTSSYVSAEMKTYDSKAKEAGVVFLNECGACSSTSLVLSVALLLYAPYHFFALSLVSTRRL